MARSIAWQETALGLGVLAFAAVVAWQTTVIPENAIYARVGPKVFPWITVGLLAVMGALLTIQGLRGGWEHDDPGETDWGSLSWLLLGLALNVGLISSVGFVAASTVLFVLTARAFGSRQPIRDLVVAILLTTISFIGFDRVLGYRIGTGWLDIAIVSAVKAALEAIGVAG
jgi:putative tricarboxylic transport membrane protein